MNLIAIETATENCSVALLHQDQITQRTVVAPQKHAELVLGFLEELMHNKSLQKSQIDGIVFGQGPGAFTGVRIAMSIVQGLALAWNVPVMAVSTLANMAQQLSQKQTNKTMKILVANDARMGEVYWASFLLNDGQLTRLSQDALAAPDAIDCTGFDVCTGSAFQSMVAVDSSAMVMADALPDAPTLLSMAKNTFTDQAKNINDIKPNYIREKVVFN